MQFYYVYHKNEQLQECIARHLKGINDNIRVVPIYDAEGQQRLTDFLDTVQPLIFTLPLVITIQDNQRKVLSMMQMYDWIAEQCSNAESTLGSVAYNTIRKQSVTATIHPVILNVLCPNVSRLTDETTALVKNAAAEANEGDMHWDTYSSVTAGSRDALSRVSISDALQNGKHREVGAAPATRR